MPWLSVEGETSFSPFLVKQQPRGVMMDRFQAPGSRRSRLVQTSFSTIEAAGQRLESHFPLDQPQVLDPLGQELDRFEIRIHG